MFNFYTRDIGVDLGTANTLIYSKGEGIILDEPSVIAIDIYTDKILATGEKAKEMGGRTPERIKVIRPLKDGVISDFMMTQAMLKEYLAKAIPKRKAFSQLRVVVGIPSGVTEVEKRAVEEVVRQMGAKEVFTIIEPMAAAIGAGLDIERAKGCMIADIGGGTTDIAVLSMGDIVHNTSIRYGGDKMDEAIVSYIRKKYNLLIGITMAEKLKIGIGCVLPPSGTAENMQMKAMGRDIISGLPKTVDVFSTDMVLALEDSIKVILDGIRTTLEQSPPELSADIVETGLILAGGGALLKDLADLIRRETGMDVTVAENAMTAVAEGTGKSLLDIKKLRFNAQKNRKY
ncbi:MAG: rod shape-determining protein [Clostridia bacterium]|nr:rod shape-determining protein [Clostridia bacterium]